MKGKETRYQKNKTRKFKDIKMLDLIPIVLLSFCYFMDTEYTGHTEITIIKCPSPVYTSVV